MTTRIKYDDIYVPNIFEVDILHISVLNIYAIRIIR